MISLDDSYYMHDMAKVERLLTDLRKDEVLRKVEPNKLLCEENKNHKFSKFMKEPINKFAVTENSILFGSDRVKDGQKFVTTEGFKEDNNFDSEVQLNLIKMTLMLDRRSLAADSVVSFIINKEKCIELKPGDIYPLLKIESDVYSE